MKVQVIIVSLSSFPVSFCSWFVVLVGSGGDGAVCTKECSRMLIIYFVHYMVEIFCPKLCLQVLLEEES